MKQNRPLQNNADCDELRDLLPAYVIGATTKDEAERVKKLLPVCPDIAKDLDTYAQISIGLTQQIDPVIPPASLKSKILEQARTPEIEPHNNVTPTNYPKFGWSVAAAIILVLLATNIFLFTQLNDTTSRLYVLESTNEEITRLLTDQQLQQIGLQSTGEQDTVRVATLLWDTTDNTLVLVSDQLAQLDVSQTYQLWFIDGTTPVSAGLFQVNPQNRALQQISLDTQLTNYQAVAISIEPSSGSTAPTTDPIALGEISA